MSTNILAERAAPLTDIADNSGIPFDQLGVDPDIVRTLDDRGITTAFPIQVAAIPPALDGRDVCGRAPTGSGKTLAFGIPTVERVGRARPGRPRALILVPTRELASQIADELMMIADRDQTIATFYGGVGFGNQLKALRRGVDIAIACPGRLADLIKQGHVDLAEVDLVVLDEADRMADMGFLPEVKRLLDACAPKRQTLLFSATLDGDVNVIIKRYMKNPVFHEEAGADADGPTAEHLFWGVERTERVDVAASIVDRVGPTVVFCRTKRGADRVAKQLNSRGVSAVAIHGNRSQGQRERALEDFRSGRAQAIAATDVAARGIHVDGVACVIHFDPTDDAKDYVHRSGRTGRAGHDGVVISLVPSEVRRDLVKQQRGLGRRIDIVRPDPMSLPEATPIDERTDGTRSGSRSGRTELTVGRAGQTSRTGQRSGPRAGSGQRRGQGAGSGDRRGSGAASGQRSGVAEGRSGSGGQRRGSKPNGGRRNDKPSGGNRMADHRAGNAPAQKSGGKQSRSHRPGGPRPEGRSANGRGSGAKRSGASRANAGRSGVGHNNPARSGTKRSGAKGAGGRRRAGAPR